MEKALLYDILVREPLLTLKYFSFKYSKSKSAGTMFFCADGKFPHGGMFDRLKGAISVYAASKVQNKTFRINFTSPFPLERYLEPNAYDWISKLGEYEENFWKSSFVFMYGEFAKPLRLLKKRTKDAHFYYGYDSLDYINNRYGTAFVWGDLYRDLFKPTAYLQQYIDAEKAQIGLGYIAIHLRFMNLLGDKTEYAHDPTLPIEEQADLKKSAMNEIKKIIAENPNKKVMLATDSTNFAEYAKEEITDLYMVPGEIRHIGTADETSDMANIKMFLDYYMISGAESVYNIVGPGMWKSAFPEYAAKIGNVQFERRFF